MSLVQPGLEIVPGLTLLRLLARGGMGEAWLARDHERAEDVVAKVLPSGAPAESLALLRREGRLGQTLSHPRLVPVYGFRAGESFSAITLKHMRGGDASRKRGAPALVVVRLARDVAEALEYLHGRGVVHRDVKVSNVLLDDEGRAHLADFGIAAVASSEEDGIVVRGGGSQQSMSPQQRAGEPATPSDDLYALGALIFELLSGRPPVSSAPASVTSSLPLPESLQGLVGALLARLPGERPSSARAVKETLSVIESEIVAAPWASDGVGPAQSPLLLQPPPRVAAGGVVMPVGFDRPSARGQLPSRVGMSFAQLVLLVGLGLAALFAVVWLPRWAEPPRAGAQTAGTPALVPKSVPPPSPTSSVPISAALPESPALRTSAPVTSGLAPAETPAHLPAVAVAPALSPPTSTPPAESTADREAEARTLARHRDSARVFEEKEEWSDALREYEAALAVDPLVAFALEGKERTGARALLQTALDFHVRNAARLSTEAVAREADALIERAHGVESPGPRHRAQVATLERAVADARTTVAVEFESDGKTEVVVSRVGALGTLTRRTMQLRPGTYTVVGSRRGYRDVRKQFTIVPKSPPSTVVVRCEEAI